MRVQFTAIRAKSRTIHPDGVRKALDEYTRDFAGDLVIKVMEYPPPNPASTYVRTMRLLGSWRVKPARNHDGIQYIITNAVQDRRTSVYYAGFHHGPGNEQKGIRRAAGWKNISDYLDRAKFNAGVQEIITKGMRQ